MAIFDVDLKAPEPMNKSDRVRVIAADGPAAETLALAGRKGDWTATAHEVDVD